MTRSDTFIKLRDSLPFSLILSLGVHALVLYYIGTWVIDFGNLFSIHKFLINEVPINELKNNTITLHDVPKDTPSTSE